MILTGLGLIPLKRLPDEIDYAAVTTRTRNGPCAWVGLDLVIPFDVEPTPAEQVKIRRLLLCENDAEDTMREQVDQAMVTLRTIINSTGAIPEPQLSNAIRFLARNQLALIRLQLRRLEATD